MWLATTTHFNCDWGLIQDCNIRLMIIHLSSGTDFHILIGGGGGGWKNICKSLVLGVRTNLHYQIIKIDTVVFKYYI